MTSRELLKSIDGKGGMHASILFIIWPFLSLISAFKNYQYSWSKNILWAFTAFYGLCFAIGAENSNADIIRYIANYQELHNDSFSFSEILTFIFGDGELDILTPTIAILLSRFSDSQILLTTVYGIIFGYFLSRNMWFLLDRLEGKIKLLTVLLLICFFLVNPIWNMNGFRMWTAAHIFIYGLLPYLFEGNKNRLLISVSSILVHFSFVVPVGVLFLYLFLGNRLLIYFSFFLATFFISEINIEVFNDIVESYAPEMIQEQTAGYRNETYVESFREGSSGSKNWYVVWYGRVLRWSILGFLVLLFAKGRSFFSENQNWLRLFCFTLLFFGVANLLSSLPSGGRFLTIANLCALALVVLYIQNRKQDRIMERFGWFAVPALLLYIVVATRIGLYSMSATAIMGNPIIAFFLNGEHISMNDVMRMIL